jgi:hypothetical protein
MGYRVLDKNGRIVGHAETDDEARELINQTPEDIWKFFVGGTESAADAFMSQLNGGLGVSPTFFEMLQDKYGRVPTAINPFEEFRDAYFKHNTFFIKARIGSGNGQMAAQLLSVLRRTLPAGAGFFVILEKDVIEETLAVSAEESCEVFYAPDSVEDTNTGAKDKVLLAPAL